MKSLKEQNSIRADAQEQVQIIEHGQRGDFALIPFQQKLEETGLFPLKPLQLEIFQVNIGKMCNQNINWSTNTVLNETRIKCTALQLNYYLLSILKDIDEEKDLIVLTPK